MRKYNVLYVAQAPFISGAERALVRLLRQLDRTIFNPYLIIGHNADLAKLVRKEGLFYKVVKLNRPDKRWPFPYGLSIFHIYKFIKENKIDLLHSNEIPSFQASGVAGKLSGIPCVCHVRFYTDTRGIRWFLRERPNKMIFISHHIFEHFLQENTGYVSKDNSLVINDGLDVKDFAQTKDFFELRKELGLSSDKFLVAMFAQLIEIKGVRYFLEMAKLVSKCFNSVHFLIVGEDLQNNGTYRRQMEEYARSLSIDSQVSFLGFRNDISRVMASADIVVCPSLEEPLGLVPMEAGACQRPVVATSVGGIPEVIQDGITGILVPPKNSEKLTEAVLRLLNNKEIRVKMGQAGRKNIENNFSAQKQTKKVEAVYQELLSH